MKLSVLSALALAASAPSVVQSWSMGPSFFQDPSIMLMQPSPASRRMMARRRRALADRMLEKTERMCQDGSQFSASCLPKVTNRYDLIDDDTKFQLTVDVPGVRMEDIDIRLDENDGKFLTIQGQRIAADDATKIVSKFSQKFSLDPTVDVDKLSATLDSGVLVVTAPKDLKQLEENVRKIPITAMTAPADIAIGDEVSTKDSATSGSTEQAAPPSGSAAEDTAIDLDKEAPQKKEPAAKKSDIKSSDADEDDKDKELMGGEF